MHLSEKHVGYAVAIVASLVVALIRLALSESLAEQARLMPFLVAVMAAAWWGGLGPGVLATMLGALLGVHFFVPPINSLWISTLRDGVNLGIFVFVGLTISRLCEALHQARRSEAEKQFRRLATIHEWKIVTIPRCEQASSVEVGAKTAVEEDTPVNSMPCAAPVADPRSKSPCGLAMSIHGEVNGPYLARLLVPSAGPMRMNGAQ